MKKRFSRHILAFLIFACLSVIGMYTCTVEVEAREETENLSEEEFIAMFRDFNLNLYKASLFTNNEAESEGVNNVLNWYTPSEILYDDCEVNDAFNTALNSWKIATLDTDSIVGHHLTVEQYYEAIILDILETTVESPEMVEELSNLIENDMADMYGVAADFLNLAVIDKDGTMYSYIKTLHGLGYTTAEIDKKYDLIKNLLKVKEVTSQVRDIAGKCNTVYEIIQKCATYSVLETYFETTVSTTLSQMAANTDDRYLKEALETVSDMTSDKGSQIARIALNSTSMAVESMVSEAAGKLVTTIIEGTPMAGLLIGVGAGKVISNICFNTDEIYAKYYTMKCFNNVIAASRETVKKAKERFMASPETSKANYLVGALDIYLKAAVKSCDYADEFAEACYDSGIGKNLTKNKTNLAKFKTTCGNTRTIYQAQAEYMTDQMWRSYFAEDYPEIFAAIITTDEFGDWTNVVIEPESLSCNMGNVSWKLSYGSFHVDAKVLPAEATNRNITFKSSNPSVAKVSADGWVTPLAATGSTTISMETYNGRYESFKLTMTTGIVSFTLDGYKYSELSADTVDVKASDYRENVVIPEKVSVGSKEYTVTEIAYDGFSSHIVETVVLPDTIEKIGLYAFQGSHLRSINFPDGLRIIDASAFESCRELTGVDLPDSLVKIGQKAFYSTGITSLTLPPRLTTIEQQAFQYAKIDGHVTIPSSVTLIDQNAFRYCANLDSMTIKGRTTIEAFAFEGCKELRSVDLGLTVAIKANAFEDTALSIVSIPSTTTTINCKAFLKVPTLTAFVVDGSNPKFTSIDGVLYSKDKKSIYRYPEGRLGSSYTILDGVTLIDSQCFAYAKYLEELVMPKGVQKLGTQTFSYMEVIKELNFPETIVETGSYTCEFCNVESVVLPPAEEIAEYMFNGCTKLKHVEFSPLTKKISFYAFYNCVELTDLILPDALTSIGNRAFLFNTKLKEVIIPVGVTSIGNRAFYSCTNLKKVTFCGNAPKSVYNDSFIDGVEVFNIPVGNTTWTDTVKKTITKNNNFVEIVVPTGPGTGLDASGRPIGGGVGGTSGTGSGGSGSGTSGSGASGSGSGTSGSGFSGSGSNGSTTKPTPVSPAGTKISKAKAGKKSMKITWKKQSKQVTGYQIQYSTSSGFKAGKMTKLITIGKKSITSKTIKKLKSKKKYYVRIRTYTSVSGKRYYSSWSAKKAVKVK